MKACEQLFDALHAAIEVRLQLFAELLASSLVGGILLVAKGQAGVVHPPDVFGAMRVDEALKKIDHAPRGGGVLSAARREGTRDQREKRAVNQRVAVDEKESGRSWKAGLHEGKLTPHSTECQPANDSLHALLYTR